MSARETCRTCGGPIDETALGGLCSSCLLRRGLETAGGDSTWIHGVSNELRVAAAEGDERYLVLGEQGRGGMGRVLRVRDHELDRDVALKELLPDAAAGATPTPAAHARELVTRLVHEARITGQLEHPGITPVHELGWRTDGTPFYTMKLVRGRTLAEAIAAAPTLALRLTLLPHFVDLCQAVAYAHDQGVVHRDLKPQNVMLGEYGETVVLDWGLARRRSADDPRALEVAETIAHLREGREAEAGATAYGQALGTPAYMPPEQALGRLDEVDARSDVYALGAVLYQILTGRPPFAAASVAELLRQVIAEPPVPVRRLEPRAPAELVELCERAMAKQRAQRLATARELAAGVGGWVPRPFHWNPERPHLCELVPELAALPRREQRRVEAAARRRALRDWRFPVLSLAGSTLVLLFCLLGNLVPLWLGLSIELAEQLRSEQRYAETLRQALASAAARGAAVPVVAPPVATEPPALVPIVTALARHARALGLAAVAASLLLAYVSLRFFHEWQRRWLLPHVRAALAERPSSAPTAGRSS